MRTPTKGKSLKASSKKQKLAAKRHARVGRPPVEGKAREPNGRISRAITPQEPADRLALEVRARMMGVNVDEARDPRLATYIGRLAILGAQHGGLSNGQYGAALRFLEIYNDWRKAIASPLAFWEGKSWEERLVLSEEEITSLVKARYEAAMRACQEAQAQAPYENIFAALQHLVIEDRQLPYMVGTLRLALNALARHFGVGQAQDEEN